MIKPFPEPAETVFQSRNETKASFLLVKARMIDKPIEGRTDNPFSWVPERRHVNRSSGTPIRVLSSEKSSGLEEIHF
jgi:hypothetical protein